MEQLWCEGVAQSGARPLREVELAAARAARTRAFLQAGMAMAGAILWVAGGIGLELGPITVSGILVGLPAGVLLARDRLRAASALKADLKRGEALLFGELEVLPRSHRALPDLRRVFVGAAAAPDPGAPEVPMTDGTPAMRRDLSQAEKIELTGWIARRRGAAIGNIVGLVFLGLFFLSLLPTQIMHWREASVAFLLAVTPLTCAGMLILRRIWLWWFARNLAAGYVVRSGEVERLLSGRLWSESGRPARWRLR